MRDPVVRAVAVSAIVAAVGGLAIAQQASEAPVADTDLGLHKGSVFDVATPPVHAVNVEDPGDAAVVPAAYTSAPPRVPHAVDDFMPIRRDENWCVDCHALDPAALEEGEPTPIPVSHYVDLRGDPDDVGEGIVGARWVCVSCHVPVTDASALVGNAFGD